MARNVFSGMRLSSSHIAGLGLLLAGAAASRTASAACGDYTCTPNTITPDCSTNFSSTSVCTVSSGDLTCDLGVHGGSHDTEFCGAIAHDDTTLLLFGEDEQGHPFCCHFTASNINTLTIEGTADRDFVELNQDQLDTTGTDLTEIGSAIAPIVADLGASDDVFDGRLDGEQQVHGGDDDDIIYGGNDDDELYGDGGDDTIKALDGDDFIDGGDGDDIIYGESDGAGPFIFSADTIYGGPGNDTIYGGVGNDVIHGDDGDTSGGDDVIMGGGNVDLIYGDGGNDTLCEGSVAGDEAYGGPGVDIIWGPGTTTCQVSSLSIIEDGGNGIDFCDACPGTIPTSCTQSVTSRPAACTE